MGHIGYCTTEKYLHVADAEWHRATFALFVDEPDPSVEQTVDLESRLGPPSPRRSSKPAGAFLCPSTPPSTTDPGRYHITDRDVEK